MSSARDMGLCACTRCGRVWPRTQSRCARCGRRLQSRHPMALQNVWAWWVLGLMFYLPANLYPMLITRTLSSEAENTIVGGALELARHGSYGIALVILLASVGIPVAKFVTIAALAFGVRHGSRMAPARRQQLHEVVEYIGRWSMIDVFVVAILSSLVQLGAVVAVRPGPASFYFALSVICTMFSAMAFDSRLIWDAEDEMPRTAPSLKDPVT
ncbi:paraquat-inducible protein A [Pseudooceanicola antarcticus]|uniref:Paraquat-inducible protein A n=2 Tax=Pseudooceanicola antarcticus TaxID=1247613 RepID=A0A285HMK2_9RHOB|nr:paraquat-inducible protein A [Pseudooceanicola antarcticus]SNY36969.1 paraquat-inducible protein A [Pseudooceanicola antarcticus]